MKLFKTLTEQSGARKSAALGEYLQIIERAEEPRKGDDERLEALLPIIGVTVEQAAEDAAVVKRVRLLEAVSVKLSERQSVASAAMKAMDELERKQREALEHFEAEQARLSGASYDAHECLREARDATKELQQLRLKHPRAFAS